MKQEEKLRKSSDSYKPSDEKGQVGNGPSTKKNISLSLKKESDSFLPENVIAPYNSIFEHDLRHRYSNGRLVSKY